MYNKRKFNKINDEKVLHKVKKQWVTISLALFMMIGGGALATHTNASADAVNNNQNQQQVSVQLGSKQGKKRSIANQPQVNHHYAKNINNVNYLKVNQSGVYNHYVTERINAPFDRVKINRPVYLHSSISFNHGYVMGRLHNGQTIKFNKAFKQYGFYHNYLRYEIRLANKRNAFITGSKNFVSYVAPNRNYKYYQKRIGNILKDTKNNTKLIKRFHELNKQRKHNLSKYVNLYEVAYNIQQNRKHPVIVNYHSKVAKINNHHRGVNYRTERFAKPNTNSLVNNVSVSSSANVVSANSASAPSVAPISNIPVASNTSSVTPASSSFASSVTSGSVSSSAKPSSASVIPSSNSNGSKSANSKVVTPSSASKPNSSKASVKPSSAVKPNSSKASAKPSSAVKSNSGAKHVASNSEVKPSSSKAVKPSSKASGSKVSSASVKPSSANKASSSSSKSASSKANVKPSSKSSVKSNSASASVEPSSASKSNRASAKSSSASKPVSSKASKPSNRASAKPSSASRSVAPSSKASVTSSKASSNGNSASASSVDSVSANVNEIIGTTFSDINKEREQNGKAPLSMNNQLQSVAGIRADQLTKKFSHYNEEGQLYNELDAKRVAPKFVDSIGENIADATLGMSHEDGTSAKGQQDPILYTNYNGKDMANMMNDGMMNWDFNHKDGHRKNILNDEYKTIGLGVAYDPKSGRYYLAEDFSYLQ